MIVGIGGFRDIGDPNDPRRRLGGVPQESNIPGLPSNDRLIAVKQGDALTYYSPREGLSIERAKRSRTRDAGRQAERNRLIVEELDRMQAEEIAATSDTEAIRAFYSEQIGRDLPEAVSSRAAVLNQAMPELSPSQAVKLAQAEYDNTGRGPVSGIPQSWVDKIGEMSELRPELAVINKLESEKGAAADRMGADSARALSQDEYAATVRALERRDEAERRVGLRIGDQFQDTTAATNAEISAEMGARGRLGKKNNPFAQQRSEKPIEDSYEVPVLVSSLTGSKYKGVPQSPVAWNRDQRAMPFFDPSEVRVVKLDPQMVVPSDIAADFGLTRLVSEGKTDAERDYAGVNVPSRERNYFAGVGKGESGSYVPGFDDRNDLASNYVPADEITLAQAVQQLYYENSTPITTFRIGIDVKPRADGALVTKEGLVVTPLNNQPKGYLENGLVEARVGNATEIKNEALDRIGELLGRLPGMEGYQVLMTNPLNDPTINQAQNRLLQLAIGEELMSGARDSGDLGLDPTRKPTYQLIRALTAGKGLEPTERTIKGVEVMDRMGSGAGDPYNEAIRGILEASPGTDAVQELRAKYRRIPGAGPGINARTRGRRDQPVDGYQKLAEALAGSNRGGKELIPTERQRADMEAVRAQYRDLPDFANQAELDALLGTSASLQDKAVDMLTRRQQVMQAASSVPQAAVANSAEQSQLNAPASPGGNFAADRIQQVKDMLRRFGG